MPADTFLSLTHRIKQDVPVASILQCRTWVRQAFRRIHNQRRWSWAVRPADFLFGAMKTAGTVAVTRNSATVTGTGTAFASTDVGRQFRTGSAPTSALYTIVSVAAQVLTLEIPYGGSTDASSAYQLFDAYQTVPAGFEEFVSIRDTQNNWSLDFWTADVSELDYVDAQRYTQGNSYYVVPTTYSPAAITTIDPPRPRYEFWPHRQNEYCYPYLYAVDIGDIGDSGVSIPAQIDGDLIFHKAMEICSLWPGPSRERPNPSYSEAARRYHKELYEELLAEHLSDDDEIWQQTLLPRLGLQHGPWWDADWLQAHSPVPPWYGGYLLGG